MKVHVVFNTFLAYCRHIERLPEEQQHTVKVLLKRAGADDPENAQQILSSMTSLDWLHCSGVTNISPLETFTFGGLRDLNIGGNKISDISPIESLVDLRTLDLSWNKIVDISSMEKLTKLETLDVSYNDITDIGVVQSLTNLTALNLRGNRISDIASLTKLTKLRSLDIRDNAIKNCDTLNSLPNLTTLLLN